MKKPPELYLVRGTESGERKVLQFPIRSHEGFREARHLVRPWPEQDAWRNRVLQLTKDPVKP